MSGVSRLFLVIGLVLFAGGCEDEPPQQRPKPPEKKKADKDKSANDKAGGEQAAAKEGGAAAEGAEAAKAPRSDRVPTASQMLGLGRDPAAREDGLPPFIRRSADGKSQLFSGDEVKPSGQYASMKVEPIEVSPIERHWGKSGGDDEEARRRRLLMSSVAAPAGPSNTQIFGDAEGEEAAPEEDDKPDSKQPRAAAEERRFKLTMYRLNTTTGQVETFERKYASEKAMEAAKKFARGQGYTDQKPNEAAVKQAQDALTKKKEAKAAEAAKAKADACKFRAQWSEGGIQQSRCFPSQAALNAFTAARAAALKKKAQPSPAKAPEKKSGAAPQGDRAIKPVKIGQ